MSETSICRGDNYWVDVEVTSTHEQANPNGAIPNGVKWLIKSVFMNGGGSSLSIAKLIFGTETLLTSHTDVDVRLNKVIEGDGSKVLKLVFENNSAETVNMGATYHCVLVE